MILLTEQLTEKSKRPDKSGTSVNYYFGEKYIVKNCIMNIYTHVCLNFKRLVIESTHDLAHLNAMHLPR